MKKVLSILIALFVLTGCIKQPVRNKTEFELRDGVIFKFVNKENRSDKEIVFAFMVINNTDSIYSKKNMIHIHIGDYGGVIQSDNDVIDEGKGEIIIEGSLKEKRFKDLYDSDLEDITYEVEEYLY